ncbi:hypothetical protein DJ533_00035 (plasmid) [Acinetobacter defluvii]|uniref:DUF723 domain-containing protein n=1 Tax=Acinetobacter defluvii TaxID=1871111 RepID=A0A2S2F876_9GAMM|nr:hypothetical protein [Acinetobacter defluvii]AWL27108.1 hypothetical protein DJ533_00035 [Acinetobacter defluvii]
MKKLSLEDFIKKSRIVHGDKYDYSESVYKGALQKIKIICPTHGAFEQIANNHLQGMNCPNCANTDKAKPKKNLDSFLKKAKTIHGDKYDYSESVYKGAQKKIKIICPTHGAFEQVVNNHLHGSGCSRCPRKKRATKKPNV